MPAVTKPQETQTTTPELVPLVVTVDTHIHKGEPVQNGDTIQVSPSTKKMLEAAWVKAKAAEVAK